MNNNETDTKWMPRDRTNLRKAHHIKRAGYQCMRCGRLDRQVNEMQLALELHHKGDRNDHNDNNIDILCYICHREWHAIEVIGIEYEQWFGLPDLYSSTVFNIAMKTQDIEKDQITLLQYEQMQNTLRRLIWELRSNEVEDWQIERNKRKRHNFELTHKDQTPGDI